MIDFEDLLRAAVWGIEEHPDVAEQIRSQYRHFVVDEYQDVNPAQQRLLQAWLGDRDDLTVVGDASQTIYSFTGATSSYLIEFARRLPGRRTAARWSGWFATTARPRRWSRWPTRSSGWPAGSEARLRLELVGQRPPGPDPVIRAHADEPAEAASVAAALRRAHRRRHPSRARSRCCSGPTRSRRRTRRRWPRPACPTWCRAPSGSSSGPRSGRRWWRVRAATRTAPEGAGLREAVVGRTGRGRLAARHAARRRGRPRALGGAGRARRPGRGVRRRRPRGPWPSSARS